MTTLQISRGRSRLKGALIGAGIGGAVGALWGSIAQSRCESEPHVWVKLCGVEFIGAVMLAIPVGSVVGLAIGVPQWTTVPPAVFAAGAARVGNGIQFGGTLTF